MPTQQHTIVEIKWPRRADTDPSIEVREQYDLSDRYEYTAVQFGSVEIRGVDRQRMRRSLKALHKRLSEVLEDFQKNK